MSNRKPVTQKNYKANLLYNGQKILKLSISDNKIYGVLAGLRDCVDTSTVDNGNLKGLYGESAVGSLINILALEHPEMYVFHSTIRPFNQPGETDHIILFKDKLILVETKTYANFEIIKVSKEGNLTGRKFGEKTRLRKLDNNSLIEKVEDYQKLFPEYNIHAITTVTRSNVKTSSENGKYKVVNISGLLSSIDYHMNLAKDLNEEINHESVKFLAGTCIKK